MSTKPVVAVDLDEVLGGFLPTLTKWHNTHYSTSYTLADYKSYNYADLWGCTNAEAVTKVHEFFKSDAFLTKVPPIPNAFETLSQFTNDFTYIVVTSRQHVIKDETEKWISLHYPNIFQQVLLGNHYDLASPDPDAPGKGNIIKRSKPDMCIDIKATLLIDDSLKYAMQCASKIGKENNTLKSVILFGEYGWNTGNHIPNVDLEKYIEMGYVARATSWKNEVRMLLEKHRMSFRTAEEEDGIPNHQLVWFWGLSSALVFLTIHYHLWDSTTNTFMPVMDTDFTWTFDTAYHSFLPNINIEAHKLSNFADFVFPVCYVKFLHLLLSKQARAPWYISIVLLLAGVTDLLENIVIRMCLNSFPNPPPTELIGWFTPFAHHLVKLKFFLLVIPLFYLIGWLGGLIPTGKTQRTTVN